MKDAKTGFPPKLYSVQSETGLGKGITPSGLKPHRRLSSKERRTVEFKAGRRFAILEAEPARIPAEACKVV